MKRWFDVLPFRLGTSSYIIPDDILPNARWLAGKVKDIELVLFDIDEYCNLPDREQAAELKMIAAASDMSYTVHLPLNINFSARDRDISIEKALKVINSTRYLDPYAYICHLECKDVPDREGEALQNWQEQRIHAVNMLINEAGIPASKVAIENLEAYPIGWNEPVIRSCMTRVCLDIGHLFLQKKDPIPLMYQWLPLTSVIHLHGVGTRDHQSLRHVPKSTVKEIISVLIQTRYHGIVTLEVFNEEDFRNSMEMIEDCL